MYSRTSGDKTFSFEPSGGLLNASLVMNDRETDSYWSIISDEAIHGPATGRSLQQVPGSIKSTYGDWKARHPATQVLSVDGREHEPQSPYDNYFNSDRGFRNLSSKDERLAPKALIFSFHFNETPHAVPFKAFEEGGATIDLEDGRSLFLFREKEDSFYRSTVAYLAPEGTTFVRAKGTWKVMRGKEVLTTFDPASRSFQNAAGVTPFQGFDTYWYIWSLTNETTKLIKG